MNRSLCAMALGLLVASFAHAQLNIDFVGQLNYQQLRNSNLSNLWGYTDEFGTEYALVGVCGTNAQNPGGISVVSLADPTNPQEVFFHPGPASIWREVKVWQDHAYITTEAENGGLVIVDLSPLPQSTNLPVTVFYGQGWTTSHTLFIDENGRLYLYGSGRGNGGVIMYDLTQDPMAPVEVGEYDPWYAHDGFARGDTMYTGHIYDGFFSIVDVSDPANPVLLGTRNTPNNFTHNVWLDDSGNHLFTTDERTNAYVGSYDVSDPTDIEFLDKLRSDNGSGAIPHNTYWLDHYLVTSYYTYGVAIYDALRPHNLVEVGHYDTSPFTGDGFRGAWGVYPFFTSGRLIISDMELGLFVLDPTYVRACWLEGTVRNAQTGAPVNNAQVTIVGVIAADPTGLGGNYATGHHTAGTYQVQASAPGYVTAIIDGVVLQNGELTLLDIDLEPLQSFAIQGLVIDAQSGAPVAGAQVSQESALYSYQAVSASDGTFQMNNVFADDYDVVAGRWGWRTACVSGQPIGPGAGPLVIELEPGYYDDFVFDFGWSVTSTASAGAWERGVPVGTSFQGQQSNPGADVPDDCGEKAFVTGNAGGGAGNDDVDDGNTILISPSMDLTGMIDPHIKLRRWFYNGGGSTAPNDRMEIRLSGGGQTVVMRTITAASGDMSQWAAEDFRVLDHLPLSADMRLRVFITDDNPGHLVEGGVDKFEVVEMSQTAMQEFEAFGTSVFPNPAQGRFTVVAADAGAMLLEVFDALGRSVMPSRRFQERITIDAALPAGTYLVRTTRADGTRSTRRLVME